MQSTSFVLGMWPINDLLLITASTELYSYDTKAEIFKKVLSLKSDQHFGWIKNNYFIAAGDKVLCQVGTKHTGYTYTYQLMLLDIHTGTMTPIPSANGSMVTAEYSGANIQYVYSTSNYIYYFADANADPYAGKLYRYSLKTGTRELVALPDAKKEKYLYVLSAYEKGGGSF